MATRAAEPEESLFILLPSRGMRARRNIELDFLTRFGGVTSTSDPVRLTREEFFRPIAGRLDEFPRRRGFDDEDQETVSIIDSVHEDGPKLAAMSEDAAAQLDRADSGVRAVPLRYYTPAASPVTKPGRRPTAASGTAAIVVTVQDANGTPVPNLRVVAYTVLANDEGDFGRTDAAGRVALSLGASPVRIETLFVETPPRDSWGLLRRNIALAQGDVLVLAPIASPVDDCVRRNCAPFSITDGLGVRIGVIDSGIGPHPGLTVVGGRNTVRGEPRGDFEDNGMGHGTHVAGIIGAQAGVAGPGGIAGLDGIAQGAELWSGRVYGAGETRATNFAILKAMILATDAGCDLLNLSLSADDNDPAVQEAVTDAVNEGAAVFISTGNQGASTVGFPARCTDAIGVSAYGDSRCFAHDAAQAAEIGAPASGDTFFANFANYGPEVRFIGPGVGVVSTVPGGGVGVRSGTSMACAAITGMAARILAMNPQLHRQANRDVARATAIQNLLRTHARSLSFGFRYEGDGTL